MAILSTDSFLGNTLIHLVRFSTPYLKFRHICCPRASSENAIIRQKQMCAKIRTLLTCNHRRIRDPIQQLSLLSVLNDFYHVDQYKKRTIGDIELYSI